LRSARSLQKARPTAAQDAILPHIADKIGRMNISLTRAAILPAMVLTPFSMLTSQQASQAQRIPQFENEDVKVWKTTVMPNAPLAMHTHDHPRVIVALSGGTMKVVNEDGTSEVHQWDTGKAYWLSLEEGKKRHADANLGDKPIEVMVVELKNAK
jgi:quercetin dioxygenase-like cupin family protein